MPYRPKTASDRADSDLRDKASRALQNAKDPQEKLRYFALARGATGILGLGR